MIEKDLCEGGAQLPVTEENKKEYVDLMVKWKLMRGVAAQTESLVKGLREMIRQSGLERKTGIRKQNCNRNHWHRKVCMSMY